MSSDGNSELVPSGQLDGASGGEPIPATAVLGSPPQTAQAQLAFQYYQGPIPPSMVAEFNRVSPGLGDRLIEQIFIEGEHRRQGDIAERIQTERLVTASIENDRRGSWFALTIALAFAAVAIYAIHRGFPWAGVTILGADLVALATVFVVGKRADQETRKQSSDAPIEKVPSNTNAEAPRVNTKESAPASR